MNCKDLCKPTVTGRIKIFEEENPSNVIFDEKNLILNSTSWLFAQLMCRYSDPANAIAHGVWGLAVGSGDPIWDSVGSLVEPLVTDYALISPFPVPGPGRIALSNINYINASTGVATTLSTTVDYQTNISTTIYPDLKGESIRELGLVGGASFNGVPTNFSNPLDPNWGFFQPNASASYEQAILINLKRFQGLILPDGVNFIISWQLAF